MIRPMTSTLPVLRPSHLVGCAIALAALAWSLTVHAQGARSWPLAIQVVASPTAAGSAQPQLTVSDRGIILSWIEQKEKTATLTFAERTATGWSEARSVASGDSFFVNWADVPSVVRLADGSLVGHWLQKSGEGTYAYDVRLAWSRDDGRTWTPSVTPHSDGTKTEHGFASLFQMPGAGLGLVWLDGRAMTPTHGGMDAAGDMSVRAAIFSPDGHQLSETSIDGRVCECCPTAVAVTADGPIVAFRNRSGEEIRDIYVARLVDGKWTEPTAVHDDGWNIPACPVNGPSLSASGRNVAIAWFTVKDDQGRAFVAFSSDSGRTFGSPIRLDDNGALGRVDIELLPDGSAAASWIEFADQRTTFKVRRIERTGTRSDALTVAGIGANRTSGYPRMARRGDELVFAWTESTNEGKLRVQTASARLPVTGTR